LGDIELGDIGDIGQSQYHKPCGRERKKLSFMWYCDWPISPK